MSFFHFMQKIILPLPLFNWNTGSKTLWKGGMQFQERISFHPLFTIVNQLLLIQEWMAHLKGHSSTFHCQWDWNPPTFLGLSQSCRCYKLPGGAILGICRGMSNVLCSWHTCGCVRALHIHVAKCDCTQQVGLPHFPPPLHSAPRPRLANGKG